MQSTLRLFGLLPALLLLAGCCAPVSERRSCPAGAAVPVVADAPAAEEPDQVFIEVQCVLENNDASRVVQSPRLLTFVDTEATIHIGEIVGPLPPGVRKGSREDWRARRAGFRLEATPHVLPSGRITLDYYHFLREAGSKQAPLSGPVYETQRELELAEGETVVFRTPSSEPGGAPMLTRVSARVIVAQ